MNDILNLSKKLKSFYENLSESNLEEASKFMSTNVMREIFNKIILKISEDEEFSDDEMELINEIIHLTNSIYTYSGYTTGLSDSDYDIITEFYRNKTKSNSFTERMLSEDGTVFHKYTSLRGTLDKIYKLTDEDNVKNKSQKTIDDWIKSSEKRILDNSGKEIHLMDEEVIVMPKFDGLSCIFEVSKNGKLERALLRGDTSRNETKDVSHIFKNIFVPPIEHPEHEYGFKTEIMMLNSDFEEYNEKYNTNYKNSRSIVSSILNSDEVDDRVKYLKIIPLRVSYYINGKETEQFLPDQVFNFPYIKCKLKELDKIRNFSFANKVVYPGYRCDGSVIYLTNKSVQKYLGREHEKQKFEVAFKFTEEVGYSEVVNINFKTGLYGTLNPVVQFKPIKLKGNKIENASLGSYARYKDLNLSKGDVIKITYDIIPYVIFDPEDPMCTKSGKPSIEPPMICSDCGTRFEENEEGTNYSCPNKKCPSRIKGKILNYCNKMNIENISYSTIEDFFEYGYLNSIKDLYSLKDHRNSLAQLPNYKEKKISNIIESIESKSEVTASELFGAIGIEGISTKKFKAIFDEVDIDSMLDLAKDKNTHAFTCIKGIKDKTAEKLVEGLNDSRDTIEFLLNRLIILPEHNKSLDLTVVFSKIRDENLERLILDNGGDVSESVNKNTSCIIVPNKNVSSNKIEKAKELNIPILTLEEGFQFVNEKIKPLKDLNL